MRHYPNVTNHVVALGFIPSLKRLLICTDSGVSTALLDASKPATVFPNGIASKDIVVDDENDVVFLTSKGKISKISTSGTILPGFPVPKVIKSIAALPKLQKLIMSLESDTFGSEMFALDYDGKNKRSLVVGDDINAVATDRVDNTVYYHDAVQQMIRVYTMATDHYKVVTAPGFSVTRMVYHDASLYLSDTCSGTCFMHKINPHQEPVKTKDKIDLEQKELGVFCVVSG